MAAFGSHLFGGSRLLFWVLAPCLALGAAAITWPPDFADGFQLAAVLVCDAAAVLLILSLWPYHRVPGVRRILAALVLAVCSYHLLDAWAHGLLPSKGGPSDRVSATVAFVAVGLPCLKYAVLGRFTRMPPPVAMAADEPLLLAAYAEARASLGDLRTAFAERPDDTYVRFAFSTDRDTVEHVWGRLRKLTESEAEAELLTPPLDHDGPPPETCTVAVAELEDWEVEYADGTFAGGYTTRAMHAFARRESLPVPREIVKRLRRYRPAA